MTHSAKETRQQKGREGWIKIEKVGVSNAGGLHIWRNLAKFGETASLKNFTS